MRQMFASHCRSTYQHAQYTDMRSHKYELKSWHTCKQDAHESAAWDKAVKCE